jgi:hypothetical protein
MKAIELQALLIGESRQGSMHLEKRLESQGFKCSFIASYQTACSLLRLQSFDLILSPMRLRDSTVFPLINLLEGSNTTLFYFQTVEEGCWWLPAVRFGRKCFGSAALRSTEFISSLEEVIMEMRTRGKPYLVPMPLTPTRQLASRSAITPHRADPLELAIHSGA